MDTPTTIPIGLSGRPAIDIARDAALEAARSRCRASGNRTRSP
jgi:hypothetical protein